MSELPGDYTGDNFDQYATAEKKKEEKKECEGSSCTVSGGRRRRSRRSRRGRKSRRSRGRKSRRSRRR